MANDILQTTLIAKFNILYKIQLTILQKELFPNKLYKKIEFTLALSTRAFHLSNFDFLFYI